MYKGSLKVGARVDVTFSCSPENNGTAGIGSILMSDSEHPTPIPSLAFVAPGASLNQSMDIPSAIAACRIFFNLPAGGSATLTVRQGALSWSGAVTQDDPWFFDVQP